MGEILILDYDVGNLRNVQKALEKAGRRASITSDPTTIEAADGIVLPGVGAFADAMGKLRASGLADPIRRFALEARKPVLGICLGMQLLTRGSEEDGWHDGLGIVDATTRLLPAAEHKLRLPHIGWNSIEIVRSSPFLAGVPTGMDVYFVHSYYVDCDDARVPVATTEYGIRFACAYEIGNVMAAQFHPEKSQDAGLAMFRNFLTYVRDRKTC